MSLIVTHSRQFHVDEIMAVMLLKTYYFEKSPKIIRTRDEALLKQYKSDSNVFVIDVGFVHNEDNLNFDHHQKDFSLTWGDGTRLSSCGLIWQWLRKNKHLHQHMNDVMMDIIENEIIKKVDAHDNGDSVWPDAFFFSGFNRKHHDNNVVDRQFDRAVTAAYSFLDNFLYHRKSKMRDEKDIYKAIKQSKNNKYQKTVVFKSNIKSAAKIVCENTDALWMIFPHSKGNWIVKAVPRSSHDLFTPRKKLPDAWLGLSNKQLQKVSGIEQLVMCHKNGHQLQFAGELKDVVLLTEAVL